MYGWGPCRRPAPPQRSGAEVIGAPLRPDPHCRHREDPQPARSLPGPDATAGPDYPRPDPAPPRPSDPEAASNPDPRDPLDISGLASHPRKQRPQTNG